MKPSSTTAPLPAHCPASAPASAATGWTHGMLGVLIFSGSLPATRAAIGGFEPVFLTAARAAIAALIGLALIGLLREKRPSRPDLPSLLLVATGVVVGFPLLTALALQHISAARSVVFIGLLPLSTALFGVLRGGERPRPIFWLFAALGSATIAGFALVSAEPSMAGPAQPRDNALGDALMLAAIVICGLGYAEGATLSRRLGGWQVICWALILSLPVMLPLALSRQPPRWTGIPISAWLGLGYVSIFSMLVGFIFWYRGLAVGGIARVGQLQLLQPFFGLLLSWLLLGEPIAPAMIVASTLVVGFVALAKRFGQAAAAPAPAGYRDWR